MKDEEQQCNELVDKLENREMACVKRRKKKIHNDTDGCQKYKSGVKLSTADM